MWSLIVVSALAVGVEGETAAAAGSATSEPTPLYMLSRETSVALRREAEAQDAAERARAVGELCELHRRLLTDVRYQLVDKLKDLRGRIYSRLRRVQADLRRDLAKAKAVGGGKGAKETGAEGLAAREAHEQDLQSLAAADSLASSLSILDATVGGPQALVGLGGRAVPDHGQELVDLIERTINPTFWDTVGGPGSIMYYQPLQCLVVRASGDVHARIGGVVGGLREAR